MSRPEVDIMVGFVLSLMGLMGAVVALDNRTWLCVFSLVVMAFAVFFLVYGAREEK